MHKNKSLIITSWYYARPLSHNIHKLTVPFSLFIQLIFTVDLFSIFTFRFPFQVRTIAYLINRIVFFSIDQKLMIWHWESHEPTLNTQRQLSWNSKIPFFPKNNAYHVSWLIKLDHFLGGKVSITSPFW